MDAVQKIRLFITNVKSGISAKKAASHWTAYKETKIAEDFRLIQTAYLEMQTVFTCKSRTF